YVKKSGAKLAFNPGTFQLRGDKELMMQCFAQSEVLFINVQEAQGILASTDKNIKNLLTEMRKLGPAIAVITDGPNGGYVFDGKDYFYIPEFTLERVETTGAGDSFGTAFIAALHHGKSIDEAMRWASFNASSVVMFIGPQEGLLTKPAIEQQLETYPEYKAIVFTDKNETPVLPPFKSPAVEANPDNQKI
ncbi:MAG TPA: carbohydrate kinase family protein, partial [Flavobacterium sp.]|nr:carbohydrate kinase family protein [Flavobacterium sp.]